MPIRKSYTDDTLLNEVCVGDTVYKLLDRSGHNTTHDRLVKLLRDTKHLLNIFE